MHRWVRQKQHQVALWVTCHTAECAIGLEVGVEVGVEAEVEVEVRLRLRWGLRLRLRLDGG